MSDFNDPVPNSAEVDKTPEFSLPDPNTQKEVYPGIDNLNQKRIRENVNGDQDDPLAPYRYLGNTELAQKMYDADQEQREEVKAQEPEFFAKIQEVIDYLESDDFKDDGFVVGSATADALTHLNLAMRLLRDVRINAVTQILKVTGPDLAEVTKIREEAGMEDVETTHLQ